MTPLPRGHQPAATAWQQLRGLMILVVLVVAGLAALSRLGGLWVALPLLPAGYGLLRALAWALVH